MLNISVSPSLREAASNTLSWPKTTRPWIVATMLDDVGSLDSFVQSICAQSGIALSSAIGAAEYMLVSIQCYLSDGARWVRRDVEEVFVGMLGDAAVVVFRDDNGVPFCPDAPELPVAHIKEMIFVGGIVGRPPRKPLPTAKDDDRGFYNGLKRAMASRQKSHTGQVENPGNAARRAGDTVQEIPV